MINIPHDSVHSTFFLLPKLYFDFARRQKFNFTPNYMTVMNRLTLSVLKNRTLYLYSHVKHTHGHIRIKRGFL